MLKFTELHRATDNAENPQAPAEAGRLTLNFDKRKRSRFRAVLDSGEECAVVLARGTVLQQGDVLSAESGERVSIQAAVETVSEVAATDSLLLTKVAYHLGNRHVSLQIESGRLRYLHDHVLDEMVRNLGLPVTTVQAPFQPEAGAYGGGHRHGDDDHGHDHGHDHDHDHC